MYYDYTILKLGYEICQTWKFAFHVLDLLLLYEGRSILEVLQKPLLKFEYEMLLGYFR